MMNKNFKKLIDEKRKEIENEIKSIIKNTRFYNIFYESLRYWYFVENERFLLVYGGAGIGKSQTLQDILSELHINYKYFLGERFEFLKQLKEILDALENYDLIVFDDCMISKRFANKFIDLLENDAKIIIVTNDLSELKATKFLIRSFNIFLTLSQNDIKYILNHLRRKYNIDYDDKIFLNIRDIVSYTLSKLFNTNLNLTIDLLLNNVYTHSSNYESLKEVIRIIIEKFGLVDRILFEKIAKQYFAYSDQTARKYVVAIINDLLRDPKIRKLIKNCI